MLTPLKAWAPLIRCTVSYDLYSGKWGSALFAYYPSPCSSSPAGPTYYQLLPHPIPVSYWFASSRTEYMKRSKTPTAHLLIKATTDCSRDKVTFAIIHLSADWKACIRQRLEAISRFAATPGFSHHVYWESPISYYAEPIPQKIQDIMLRLHKDQLFIILDPEEEKSLAKPANHLETHQMCITQNGIAHYRAYTKYHSAQYYTEEFNLSRFIHD